MSTSPDVRLPTWATDTIVEAGHADAGYPTKVEPSEPTKAQGYIGGEASPANTDNWLQYAQCRWLQYLAPLQLQNFKREASGVIIGTEPVGQTRVSPFPCHYRGVWVIPGSKKPGVNNAGFAMSWPGSFNYELAFEPARLSQNCYAELGVQYAVSAAADGDNCIVGVVQNTGATNTKVLRSYQGGAPSAVTVSASVTSCTKVFGSAGVFLLLPMLATGWVNGAKYYTSEDGGASWTEQTVSDAPTGISVLVAATGPAGFALCWSDSDVIGFTANGSSIVYVAMGNGRRPVGITLVGSVAYVLCASGELARVTQGGSVSIVSTVDENVSYSDLPGSSKTYFGSLLASDGVRAMVALGHDHKVGPCYYSSLDAGETWVKTRLTSALPMRGSDMTDGGGQPLCVTYAEGEFLLLTYSWPLGDGLDCNKIEIWRSLKV